MRKARTTTPEPMSQTLGRCRIDPSIQVAVRWSLDAGTAATRMEDLPGAGDGAGGGRRSAGLAPLLARSPQLGAGSLAACTAAPLPGAAARCGAGTIPDGRGAAAAGCRCGAGVAAGRWAAAGVGLGTG